MARQEVYAMSVAHRDYFTQGVHPIDECHSILAHPLSLPSAQVGSGGLSRLPTGHSTCELHLLPPWCFHARRVMGESFLRESIGAG
jgi:hypothetical protein